MQEWSRETRSQHDRACHTEGSTAQDIHNGATPCESHRSSLRWSIHNVAHPMNGRISVLGLVIAALFACDGSMQTVSLTAEDFRFTPDLVRVRASDPVTLSVYNAGREVHEFDSPILMYAAKTSLPKETPESASTPGIVIRPGQSLRVVMAPPAGTYLYICRRKGHANMTGTLIVE